MCIDMDRRNIILIPVVLTAIFAAATFAQQTRCFQYTWLGPRYNNESTFLNATCAEATRLSAGVPCVAPLVASYDGTWPDVAYIWMHHPEASCILADNDVCASYTYYFDGVVENSTYFCSRAVDANGDAVTSGCYEERQGSFSTRVCLCRSVPGGVPCNNAALMKPKMIVFTLIASLLLGIRSSSYCLTA